MQFGVRNLREWKRRRNVQRYNIEGRIIPFAAGHRQRPTVHTMTASNLALRESVEGSDKMNE